MATSPKGRSPFYPGQPVPVELFAGRRRQIEHIMERGVGQVRAGKPVAIYVEGEYGIGKSSVAGFVQSIAEQRHHMHGIYVSLGAAATLDDLGVAVLNASIRSGTFDPSRVERIRNWLAKYIGDQVLFGLTLRTEALKRDAPNVTSGILPFLQQALDHLRDVGVEAILLIFDEINGITANAKFAHFIKGLVDANALSRKPLPLLLMLCGVEERRREMIRLHQPVERIFDVVQIEPMSSQEMREFFGRAFDTVGISVLPEAMDTITRYSAGFPKMMHIIGDAAFWHDQDGVIDEQDAIRALITAAEEVGRKYVDQQVFKALRSRDYHSILGKIASAGSDMSFLRSEVAKDLTEPQRKKLDNFLMKMRKLNVIRQGEIRGEYVFNLRMVWLYIYLQSLRKDQGSG